MSCTYSDVIVAKTPHACQGTSKTEQGKYRETFPYACLCAAPVSGKGMCTMPRNFGTFRNIQVPCTSFCDNWLEGVTRFACSRLTRQVAEGCSCLCQVCRYKSVPDGSRITVAEVESPSQSTHEGHAVYRAMSLARCHFLSLADTSCTDCKDNFVMRTADRCSNTCTISGIAIEMSTVITTQ